MSERTASYMECLCCHDGMDENQPAELHGTVDDDDE